ncbi:hypothetical protein Tco_0901221 [Tanacetum coccineum]
MAGPVEGGGPEGTDDREETPPPLAREQIEGHVFALKSLIKSHNQRNKRDLICLDFKLEDTEVQDLGVAKGKEVMDEDLGLDYFVRSEEAYVRTELLKGEIGETHRRTSLVFNRRDNRSSRNTHPGESRRNEYRNNYRSGRDAYLANRTRDDRAPYHPLRGEYNHRVAPVLSLEYLTKRPKEILATETQLHLPAPRPMLNPLRSGNTDRYYDYHQEKGHHTNDCIRLRKQLEMALESRKLNHLVKDL